jgi:eukaryotic-like serine/threonine-protein kinase
MVYWKEGDELNSGKYLVEQLLGSGGFGVTYRIRETRTNKLFALKTLNEIAKNQPDFPQLQSKFINEAIATQKQSASTENHSRQSRFSNCN